MDLPSFLAPKSIEHDVGDKTISFYPMSVGMAFRARPLGKHIARLLSLIFTKQDKDCDTTEREIHDAKDLPPSKELIISAAAPEVLRMRAERQDALFQEIVDSLLADDNKQLLCDLLMDSMREEFPKDQRPKVGELLDGISLPVLTELMIGVGKANKAVFGPLEQKMAGISAHVIAKLQVKAESGAPDEANSEPASPS